VKFKSLMLTAGLCLIAHGAIAQQFGPLYNGSTSISPAVLNRDIDLNGYDITNFSSSGSLIAP
jgi:hypothetical protein